MDKLDTWEFGCLAWCEFAARLGIQLISDADLDLGRYHWGFSEEYLLTPNRLLEGRLLAGYHLMICNGRVSGGPGVPKECLSLPGFHVAVEWALAAHSSYLPFNTMGHEERGRAQIRLRRELQKAGYGDGRWVLESQIRQDGDPDTMCRACGALDHQRVDCPVWPPGIGEAIAANPDSVAHKWRLRRSPELEGFPETHWGVPIFQAMSEAQKVKFLAMLGHRSER